MGLNQNLWLTVLLFTILTIIIGIIFIRLFQPKSLMISLLIIYFLTPISLASLSISQITKYTFPPEIGVVSITLIYLSLTCFIFLHFAVDKPSISMEILQVLHKGDRNREEIHEYIQLNFQNDDRIKEIVENSFFLREDKLKFQIRFLLFIWRIIAPVRLERE